MKKASEAGIAFAMNNLGYFYEHGIGCDIDKNTAFKWYCNAARTGLPPAYLNVYHCYSQGVGVDRDMEKAFLVLQKAAEKDFPEGKVAL